MKAISWNVNGLRAVAKKGFEEKFYKLDADIFAIQETKLQEGQCPFEIQGYHDYFHYAQKKGYSGTAVFSKQEPKAVFYGIGIDKFDDEGRVLTLEFDNYYFVCVYTPNAQDELKRIDFRCEFEDEFRKYLKRLAKKKGAIICGDMNVAHNPIDLARPKANIGHAGFSDQEREKFGKLLDAGFIDTFRYLNPDLEGAYSWWSYRGQARVNNVGWRIDYFLISENLKENLLDAKILNDCDGSDHCPVYLELSI